MANKENLRRLSTNKAREIGSKGGKASVESGRRKKALRDAMSLLLSSKITNKEDIKFLKNMGIEDEDMNYQSLLLCTLFNKAVGGDVRAIKLIVDIIGETSNKIELSYPKEIEEVSRQMEKYFEGKGL